MKVQKYKTCNPWSNKSNTKKKFFPFRCNIEEGILAFFHSLSDLTDTSIIEIASDSFSVRVLALKLWYIESTLSLTTLL